MNLPNKLTILRVLLMPVLVLFLMLPYDWCRWVALGVFVLASLTDTLDGHIARSKGLITNFGKFLDPVADKMLVLSAMICLCALGQFPAWLCVLVACRELAVDGLRLIACEKGLVLAAGKLGKIKTTVQMVTLAYCIARLDTILPGGNIIRWILLGATALFTALSGCDYFLQNRRILEDEAPKKEGLDHE